jgi:hypothetical protein
MGPTSSAGSCGGKAARVSRPPKGLPKVRGKGARKGESSQLWRFLSSIGEEFAATRFCAAPEPRGAPPAVLRRGRDEWATGPARPLLGLASDARVPAKGRREHASLDSKRGEKRGMGESVQTLSARSERTDS